MNDFQPRHWRTALAMAATTVVLSACSGTADRNKPLGYADGTVPGNGSLSVLATIGLFVLAPLLIVAVIAALVWLPGMVRGTRYRPSKGWSAPPLWFGGPSDPAAAVESAQVGELVRGGASGGW